MRHGSVRYGNRIGIARARQYERITDHACVIQTCDAVRGTSRQSRGSYVKSVNAAQILKANRVVPVDVDRRSTGDGDARGGRELPFEYRTGS